MHQSQHSLSNLSPRARGPTRLGYGLLLLVIMVAGLFGTPERTLRTEQTLTGREGEVQLNPAATEVYPPASSGPGERPPGEKTGAVAEVQDQ